MTGHADGQFTAPRAPQPVRPDRAPASDPNRCLRLRSPFGRCDSCVQVCQAGALRFTPTALRLADECIGCGRCAAVCPTAALSIEGFADEPASESGGALYVDCWKIEPSQSPGTAKRVPCLGGIALHRLMDWQGPRRSVVLLDRGWCAGCSAGSGTAHPAGDVLARARALLTELGLSEQLLPRLEHRPLPRSLMPRAIPDAVAAQPLSRRRFLESVTRQAARFIAPPALDAPLGLTTSSAGHSARIPDTPRSQFLSKAAELALQHGRALPAQLFPALQVSEACCNHGICAAVCPVQALQRYEKGGTAGIVFNAWSCISCGDCTRACPERALRLELRNNDGAPGWSVALTHWQLRDCSECGQSFAAAGAATICPACCKTRELARSGFAQLFRSAPQRDDEQKQHEAGQG